MNTRGPYRKHFPRSCYCPSLLSLLLYLLLQFQVDIIEREERVAFNAINPMTMAPAARWRRQRCLGYGHEIQPSPRLIQRQRLRQRLRRRLHATPHAAKRLSAVEQPRRSDARVNALVRRNTCLHRCMRRRTLRRQRGVDAPRRRVGRRT